MAKTPILCNRVLFTTYARGIWFNWVGRGVEMSSMAARQLCPLQKRPLFKKSRLFDPNRQKRSKVIFFRFRKSLPQIRQGFSEAEMDGLFYGEVFLNRKNPAEFQLDFFWNGNSRTETRRSFSDPKMVGLFCGRVFLNRKNVAEFAADFF